MKMGIKTKLITLFVLLISLPLIFLGGTSYYKTRGIIQKDLDEMSKTVLGSIEDSIDNYLDRFENNLNMLGDNVDLKEIQVHPEYEPFMMGLFQGISEADTDIKTICFATKNKEVFIYPKVQNSSNYDVTGRAWYSKAYEKKDIYWSEPYLDKASNKLVVTVSKSVYDDKKEFVGVVGIDIDLNTLSGKVNKMKVGNNGYAFIMDSTGILMTYNDKSKIGNILDIKEIVEAAKKDKQGDIDYTFNENNKNREKCAIFSTMSKTGWKIVSTIYVDEVLDRANVMKYTTSFVGAISLIIAICIAYIFSENIKKIISSMVVNMEKIKNGDLTVNLNIKSKDEFQVLSDNFNSTSETLRGLIKDIQNVANETKNASESLAASSEEANTTSEEVSNVIDQIASAASTQAYDAEQSVSFIGKLSTKLNELKDNTNDMYESAEHVMLSSNEGTEVVEELKQKTKLTSDTTIKIEKAVLELSNNAKDIGDILNTIIQISEQTNLLALNASIEASRAGEMGRGFSVVAEEIRKLAEESRKAVDEIKVIVKTIEDDSKNTVEVMQEVKSSSNEQTNSVLKVSSSFEKISKSVESITEKVYSINGFVNEVTKEKELIVQASQNISAMSQQTAASAEEVSASMKEQIGAFEEVASAAEKLNGLSTKLNDDIKTFKI